MRINDIIFYGALIGGLLCYVGAMTQVIEFQGRLRGSSVRVTRTPSGHSYIALLWLLPVTVLFGTALIVGIQLDGGLHQVIETVHRTLAVTA